MGSEPSPVSGQSHPFDDTSGSSDPNRLQKFYDQSSTNEQAADDEESLFAELYGKQEDVKDIAAPSTQQTAAEVTKEAEDDETGSEESGSEEEEESDDDAEQDVKIILMSGSDCARPAAGRAAPNKYIRQEAPGTASSAPSAAPMMSTDGDMPTLNETHVSSAEAETKTSQRSIAKMIPEKPEPIDSNGHHITFPTVYDVDIDALPEKPWKNPMADPSDWFNYGFDEDSWRAYCQRQVQMRLSVTKPRKQKNPDHNLGGGGGAHHHRKHGGPITATVPPPHRPPQAISQDVLQLGGGSNFVGSSGAVDPRARYPPRHDAHPQMHHHHNKVPIDHRAGPPAALDPGRPSIGARYAESESSSDPRGRPPPPPPPPHRHSSPPRHESSVRMREESRDLSRARFESSRHSAERRESSMRSSSGYDKRGRPSPPRDSHYDSKHRDLDRRPRSSERDHRREYDRRELSYREKRPRSPMASSRDYDSKRRR